MQMIIGSKRWLAGWLLCSLLLGEYFTYGPLSPAQLAAGGTNQIGVPASSLADQPSSMGDRARAVDFTAAVSDHDKLSIAADGKSRGNAFKNNYSFWAATSASHLASLINYLRLSEKIYAQSHASRVIAFLHEKDGMK